MPKQLDEKQFDMVVRLSSYLLNVIRVEIAGRFAQSRMAPLASLSTDRRPSERKN